MEELKSAINWFEIPAADFERAGGVAVMGKSQVSPEVGFTAVSEGSRMYLQSMN